MAVRGTFDLNDRPARDALRRLRREGAETDATMARLGQTVDDTFTTKNVEQGRRYERMLRDVDATARASLGSVRREWGKTERQTVKSVATSEAAVDKLQVRLDRLGATKVSPQVDLDGVAEAIAQVELLQRRLGSLSRRTATPNVGLPGTGFGGGGRVPTTGAQGGESFFSRGLKIPFAGVAPWPLVGGALAAVPPLAGGAGALAGSLGAAALGAGSIGLGAAGVGSAALGLGLPVGITAAGEIKEASEALKKYREEVIQSGRDSAAAHQALRAYNMALESAPGGTRRFLRARTMLGQEFGAATAPARSSFTSMGTRGLNVARQLTPTVAPIANRFFDEARAQTDDFGDFLAGSRSRGFITAMGDEATRTLGPAEAITENIAETMMNLTRASRPFFREGVGFLREWTGGWRQSSRDIKGARSDMRGWVDNLKSWGKLIGATGRLGGDLLGAGVGSGQNMVGDLTQQLDKWDRWVERNPRKVKRFFDESVETVEKIASGVGHIAKSLWEVGRMLGPLLNNAAELVTLMGNAGLLTPGALPLLIGAGAGARGAFGRGGGTRGTTGGAGGAPLILGGGAAAGGAATFGRFFDRGTYDLARSFGRGRVASTVAGLGAGGAGARGAAFGRGFVGRVGPLMAFTAALGAAGTQGDATERLQGGLSQATFGLIAPPRTGAEKEDEGLRHAAMVASFQARRFGNDPRGLRRQLLGLRRKIRTLGEPDDRPEGLEGFLTQDIIGGGGPREVSEDDRIEAEALRRRRRHIAGSLLPETELSDIQGAFQVNARHGDPRKAAEGAARGIEQRIKQMRGRTAKEFGRMSVSWVREMADAEPKLRGTYDRLTETVENRLQRLGQNVAVINGRIVDTSRKSWSQVADAIDSETQRALSRANENLTALEERAFTILRGMGFSRAESKNLVYEAKHGHPSKAGSKAAAEAHHHGMPAPPTVNSMGGLPRGENAGGGRLPMMANGSMQDDIYLGNNQWGAAGELMVNRHTERRVDRLLGMAGTTLGREVSREQRGHSKPLREENAFLGRRMGGAPFGRYAAVGDRLSPIYPAGALAQRMGLSVGEGPGFGGIPSSGHTGGSLHYSGLAYDVSGSPELMRRYFFAALRSFRSSINELFYDPIGWYIDNGVKVPGAIGGHSDHVHIGFKSGGAVPMRGGARFAGGMGGAGRAMPQVNLRSGRSGLGGVHGAIADRAGEMQAAGLSKRLNRLIGSRGGAGAGMRGAGSLQRFNHSYPEMHLGEQGPKLGAGAIRSIAQWAGLPPTLFQQITLGESGGYPGMVGVDPGGTEGLGLWMITTGYNDALIRRLGGRKAMLNPLINAKAAKEIYDSQGVGAWYGTSHVNSKGWSEARKAAHGGRMRGFAGWFKDGFTGTVSGPTLMGVGEAGDEDVTITPRPRRRRGGRGGGGGRPIQVNVNMGGVTIRGNHDAQRVGKDIGDNVAERIRKALEDSDGVGDEELVG